MLEKDQTFSLPNFSAIRYLDSLLESMNQIKYTVGTMNSIIILINLSHIMYMPIQKSWNQAKLQN